MYKEMRRNCFGMISFGMLGMGRVGDVIVGCDDYIRFV